MGIEIQTITKRSGLVTEKLKGFHHDYLNFLENSGVVNLKNKVICPKTGIMKADVCWGGRWIQDKTFFPSTWTQEKVMQEAVEILQKYAHTATPKGTAWIIEGTSNSGTEIYMVIEKSGKISTFYPIWQGI